MAVKLLLLLCAILSLVLITQSQDILDQNQNNEWYRRNYKCPEGWTQRCEECYLFVKTTKSWTDAQYHCRQQGGDLVTIKDFATNMFLTRYVQHESKAARTIWIGANDRDVEGDFKWSDGTTALKQEFRWLPDEPQDSPPGEDCVEMFVRSHQYLWNDAPCSDELPFVCQTAGCVNGTHRCDNGKCISKQTICDGVNNCGDNSDEKNCSSTCGSKLYGMSGNFTSPNYPKPYGDDRECSWVIEVPVGYKIKLRFLAFHLEIGFDYVEVFDGQTLTSKSFGRWDGKVIPRVFTSTSNYMRVLLNSDSSDSFEGFVAEYQAVKETCNEEITINKGSEYIIESPNYPNNYDDDATCNWKINNGDPLKVLTMVIYELDTEKDNDIIEVRDGYTKDNYVIGRYSGIKKEPITIFSSKDKLWVKFQSNFENNKKGFRAVVRSGCYVEMNVSQGLVMSPGFGYAKYPNLLRCTWKISEPQNRSISFIFHKFDTEKKYDEMTLRTKSGKTLAVYSGTKTKAWLDHSWLLETNESYVEIKFHSDVTYEMNGFNVSFSVGCPNLSGKGGTVISGKTHYGGKISYACNDYYVLKNGQNSTCEYGGQWSKPTPYCQEIICPHPGVLKDGSFNVLLNKQKTKKFSLNTTIQYSCDAGFKLDGGDVVRRCQRDSTWTGTQPTCKANECKAPGIPTNGIITGNNFRVGSSVSFSCIKGYHLVGKKTITCNVNAKWSSEIPKCEEITCKIPQHPENGRIQGIALNTTKATFESTLTVVCDNGFKLSGNATVKCLAPGTWQPTLPKCVDVNECSVSKPCNGPGSQCINTKGSFVCICQRGYRKTNPTTCEDINECKEISNTVMCNQNCTNVPGGYKCSCKEGYFLYDGNNKTLTRAELKIAIVNHTCFGKACPIPKIPARGFVINYGNRYPTVLEYHCERGYVLTGDQHVKCLKNQTWDKEFPTCDVASCAEPLAVNNAKYTINGTKLVKNNEYKLETTVSYVCNPGYERSSGNMNRECSHNLTHAFWSGILPSCKRKSCGPLQPPAHGILSKTGQLFGDEAVYTCDGGYQIMGPSKRTCEANGKWSGATPVCAAMPCPDPGVPEHGTRMGNVALGETVTYRCTKMGYTLVGSASRTCVHKNKTGNYWTGTLPSCNDTASPTFICPDKKSYILPRAESEMFVNWTVPIAVDNSGDTVAISVSPKISPPTVLKFGVHEIIYTAVDKAGNKGTCKVVVDIQDKQKPRLKCPGNIVIASDLPTKVTWGRGLFSDNIGVTKVVYIPHNGSTFASNKYHRVVAIVTDDSGNVDTCVIEVYIKGCGCTMRGCPNYKPSKGISTCHVNNLGLLVISCNLECKNNDTFVDSHFNGKAHICHPKTGWPEKNIPGCEARKPLISCYNATFRVKYNETAVGKIKEAELPGHLSALYQELKSGANCANVEFGAQTYEIVGDTISLNFKIVPHQDIVNTAIKQLLPACVNEINNKLAGKQNNLVKLVTVANKMLFGVQVNGSMESCCNNTKEYCCPSGNLIRTTGQTFKDGVCIPCSPGTFYNVTSNQCVSCPVGKYTPSNGYDQCLTCQKGSSTLHTQSTKCTELCKPGTYSSTGLTPTCRKCDYGEIQPKSGMKKCLPCPKGTTTFARGSFHVDMCKAPCPAGEYSKTGLLPCVKCSMGTYQDGNGRSVCKQCPSGGIYAGKEGATKVSDCPTTNPCDQKLCGNESTCVPGNYSFTCVCKPGWTGKYCKTDIDECASSPCGNHGNCTDLVNNYNCTCIRGITGRNCEKNINDCKNDTCANLGVCEDLINDFKCLCPAGYTGKRCEIDVDECASSPCQHKSICTDLINDFSCNCTSGYTGKRCEVNIDECKPKPCFNNATCVDLINDVRCVCKAGFTGKYCGTDIDECADRPCLNNATCLDMIDRYTCQCKPGFTGFNCSIEINECDPNPCLQNSTCVDLINKFKCNCQPGYYGVRCEFEKDECKSLPCKNNATCVDKVNDFQCVCPLGYTGKQCDIDINECKPNPCINGTCNDLIGDYSCTCQKGFTGRNCSAIIDNCEISPCVNNATCTNLIGDYKCNCLAGYEGKKCDVDINECTPDPCNGNAVNCTDLINDFICYCKLGFRGENCSEIIDNCNPQPCYHNSTCKNVYEKNDFMCNCTRGYYGKQCENETNECKPKPCQNNSTCTDLIGDYKCTCPTGFTGKNCEININDCKNVSCLNGGTCKDLVNDYKCICSVTHKGAHCEKKIPNEVDISLPGGDESYIRHSNISSLDEFTLSLWFRYTSKTAQGTFLTLLNTNKPNLKFVEVNEVSVQIHLQSSASEKVFFPKKVNDKYWHHLVLSISGKTAQLKVVLDRQVVEDSTKTLLQGLKFFHPSGLIVLGKKVHRNGSLIDDGFVGEISQFGIWSKFFTDQERTKLLNNCTVNLNESIIPWVGLLNGAGRNVSLIEKWSCGKNVCPADYTGKFCETEIDKNPPTILSCPKSKKVLVVNATTRIYWKEPVFTDDVGVVSVERSHAPGQMFPWGNFIVSYIAKDAFDNSVTCTFEIYVTPHDCPTLLPSLNSLKLCKPWEWGQFCDFECRPTFKVAVPKPPFYSCGKMGTWSHGPPIYPENPNNLLPSCTATIEPGQSGTNSFTYTATKCDETFKKNFIASFKTLIRRLQASHGICGDTCNFDNLQIQCAGGNRTRRAATPTFNLAISFDTNFDNIESIRKEALQQGVKDGSIDLTIKMDGENLSIRKDMASVAETTTQCRNGSVLKNGACVLCPPGTYKVNATCNSCPIGSYSSDIGSESCMQCPNNRSTFGVGATSIANCTEHCVKGEYLDEKLRTCKKCELGFYKEVEGFASCKTCPLGSSTKITGAVSQQDCSVVCPLGTEMINSKCAPCLAGYYRNSINQSECIACPYGKTTYEAGDKCLAKCPFGQEVSEDGLQCMECNIGYYRNSLLSSKCDKCPNNQITRGFESTNSSSCFAPVSSTLYDATLSFTSLTWNDKMADSNTPEFRHTAHTITKALLSVYKNDHTLNMITIKQLQSGSVVSLMTFSFVSNTNDPFRALRTQVSTGSIGGINVNASTLVTDRCTYFKCPIDQYCWYNTTGAGCSCKQGYYMSNDGQKCFMKCKKDYCMNGGQCRQTDAGLKCSCPKDYSGDHCEDKDSKKTAIGLIIGLIVAAIALAVIIGCCLKRRQRTGEINFKLEPLTDNVNVNDLKSTPIVVHVDKNLVEEDNEKPKTLLSFVNKAADMEDGNNEDINNEAPKRKESKTFADGTKDATLIAAEQSDNLI